MALAILLSVSRKLKEDYLKPHPFQAQYKSIKEFCKMALFQQLIKVLDVRLIRALYNESNKGEHLQTYGKTQRCSTLLMKPGLNS